MLGLVVASLAAAYMSTISTHLNWGASYIVDDFYRRFLAPDRDEKHYVTVGRASTVLLIVLAGVVSLWLQNAYQAFQILLQIGAGTGAIFLLRWFWWRVNAWSEIAGMAVSFVVAVYVQFIHPALGFAPVDPAVALLAGVALTTAGWLIVTLITPPTDARTLQAFYDRVQPFAAGWRGAVQLSDEGDRGVSASLLCWFLGCVIVYGALFGAGELLYGRPASGVAGLGIAAAASIGLFRTLPRVRFR
jgi:Na+/proline symporter